MKSSRNSDIENFVSWFQTHIAPVKPHSMIQSVREECGLESTLPMLQKMLTIMLKHRVN